MARAVTELDGGRLRVERRDGVGRLVINQPGRRNAIRLAMWEGIEEAMGLLAADERVRVVVLRGAGGGAFSAGADISEFESVRRDAAAQARYDEAVSRAYRAVADIAKPTIAHIEGFCMGGGMAIAMCCDLRFATPDAVFGIPAARLGIGYGYEHLRPLVGQLGPTAVKEIFFTGRRFDAAEALAMRVVSRVLERLALAEWVAECTATIAANAPLSLRAVKLITAEILKDPQERDLARCRRLVEDCERSEDYLEGYRAFLEKRRPAFRGR